MKKQFELTFPRNSPPLAAVARVLMVIMIATSAANLPAETTVAPPVVQPQFQAAASPSSTQLPPSALSAGTAKLVADIARGQATSHLELLRTDVGCAIKAQWASPFGSGQGEHHLAVKICDSLFAVYAKLPKPKQVPAWCSRTRMDIQAFSSSGGEKGTKSSCYGVNAPTAAAYETFSSLLFEPFNTANE